MGGARVDWTVRTPLLLSGGPGNPLQSRGFPVRLAEPSATDKKFPKRVRKPPKLAARLGLSERLTFSVVLVYQAGVEAAWRANGYPPLQPRPLPREPTRAPGVCSRSEKSTQPTVFTTRRIVRCFVVPKPFKQVVYVLLAASPRNFCARLVAFFYCPPSRSVSPQPASRAVKIFCKR